MSNVNWLKIFNDAVRSHDFEAASLAIEHGEKIYLTNQKEEAFLKAIIDNDIEAVQYLLQKNIDVNLKFIGTENTAMMIAASHGNIKMMQVLLEAGADIEARNVNSPIARPLWDAAIAVKPKAVRFLLDMGAYCEDNIVDLMAKYKPEPIITEIFEEFLETRKAKQELEAKEKLRKIRTKRLRQFRNFVNKRR